MCIADFRKANCTPPFLETATFTSHFLCTSWQGLGILGSSSHEPLSCHGTVSSTRLIFFASVTRWWWCQVVWTDGGKCSLLPGSALISYPYVHRRILDLVLLTIDNWNGPCDSPFWEIPSGPGALAPHSVPSVSPLSATTPLPELSPFTAPHLPDSVFWTEKLICLAE